MIAAAYAVLTVALAPISFGVYQVRVAEALTILPFITDAAVLGLLVGCAIANYFGGNGIYDIVVGSLLTFWAAILTRYIGTFARKIPTKSNVSFAFDHRTKFPSLDPNGYALLLRDQHNLCSSPPSERDQNPPPHRLPHRCRLLEVQRFR